MLTLQDEDAQERDAGSTGNMVSVAARALQPNPSQRPGVFLRRGPPLGAESGFDCGAGRDLAEDAPVEAPTHVDAKALLAPTLLLVGTVVAGAGIAWSAVMMAGAGHGWSSQLVSAIGLLTAPLAGVAWLARGETWARLLAGALVAVGLAVDVAILVMTRDEGWDYVGYTWRGAAPFVLVWAFLWPGWQVLACMALVSRGRLARS